MNKNKKKQRVAVLISGNGSNLQALITTCKNNDYPAEIALVISNIPNVKGLQRAIEADIPALTIPHSKYNNRADFESTLNDALTRYEIDIICLAGFMRILGKEFVQKWSGRILNIHPSILPKYKGLNTHERALNNGEKEAGCTVHHVVAELDAGPNIIQAIIPIYSNDTAQTLKLRVQTQEHIIYPIALNIIAQQLSAA